MDLTPKELYSSGKPIVIKGLLPSQKQVNAAMEYLCENGLIRINTTTDFMQCFEDFVVVGDSVSCGYTNTQDGSTIIDSATAKERGINWPSFLSKDISRNFNNLAIGGTTAADWRGSHVATASDVDADCYIVMLGINDMVHSRAVGTSGDISENVADNNSTFYGDLDYVVRTLLSYNPNAKVFLLTIPLEIANKTSYNEAIRYIGTHTENVHLIDLDTKYKDDFATGGFMRNNQLGVHLTTLGYRKLATMIRDSINEYMESNFNQFYFIPYVSD